MELVISICALVVGVVSVGIAVWQGRISRRQLELAKDTERRTEDTLKEIRVATDETRRIVQDVKDNIDDRITKIIDSRIQSDQAKEVNSSAMSQMLMQAIVQGMTQQKPDDGQK
jgi:glucose-6-phosphate-specific signal transduction histidine kinase